MLFDLFQKDHLNSANNYLFQSPNFLITVEVQTVQPFVYLYARLVRISCVTIEAFIPNREHPNCATVNNNDVRQLSNNPGVYK